jgi:hypothetical protein
LAKVQNIIEKEFVNQTLHILQNYEGPYGVTLLLNCLLGLIVLPQERYFGHTEDNRLGIKELGIDDEDIKSWGDIREDGKTGAQLLRCMRNSIAHIQIKSISENGEIASLSFADKSGFKVVLSLEKIKTMVYKLAEYIH